MLRKTVGYDYYVGGRRVHTGITRNPASSLRTHNRATGKRGRLRIRTRKLTQTEARTWKRRQAYRGAPTVGYALYLIR